MLFCLIFYYYAFQDKVKKPLLRSFFLVRKLNSSFEWHETERLCNLKSKLKVWSIIVKKINEKEFYSKKKSETI